MLRGQRSTAGRDHRLNTGLIHLREVEVSLDQHREPSLPDGSLAEIQAVQGAALDVNRRFRRVQVFRLLVGVHCSSAECDHRAGLPANRNHEPVPESIHDGSVVTLNDQAAPNQQSVRKPMGEQVPPQTIAQGRRIPQPQRFDCRRCDAAVGKLVPNPCIGCGKLLSKPGGGGLVHLQQRFALGGVGPLLIARLHLGQRHAEPLRQQLDRVLEPNLLVKLEKLEHVTANPTAVAIEEALVAVHLERGRLLGVKRAESFVVGPRLLQRHVVLNHHHDIRVALQVIDERLWE